MTEAHSREANSAGGPGFRSPPRRDASSGKEMRPATPPRKRLPSSEAVNTLGGMPDTGPKVVFSPGKRLCADGAAVDAAMEMKAFLRHKGIADADIPDMMNQRSSSSRATPVPSSWGSSLPSSATSVHATATASRAPKRLKLADHARALTAPAATCGEARWAGLRQRIDSSPERPDNTFSADLLDVLTVGASPTPGASPSAAVSSSAAAASPQPSQGDSFLASQQGRWLNGSRGTASENDSCFEDIDDDVLLAAVLEVEQRVKRERDAPASLSQQAGPGRNSASDSLPVFRL